MTTFTDEPEGRLHLVPADMEHLDTYDLSRWPAEFFQQLREQSDPTIGETIGRGGRIRELTEDLRRNCLQFSWLWCWAIAKPGEVMRTYFEENRYEYEKVAVFDAETAKLSTNFGRCPVWFNHHIGSVCPVCGLKD
ncbi:MAG: hypothetical protein WC992_02310 [Acholeplasmataceae bacterium]